MRESVWLLFPKRRKAESASTIAKSICGMHTKFEISLFGAQSDLSIQKTKYAKAVKSIIALMQIGTITIFDFKHIHENYIGIVQCANCTKVTISARKTTIQATNMFISEILANLAFGIPCESVTFH